MFLISCLLSIAGFIYDVVPPASGENLVGRNSCRNNVQALQPGDDRWGYCIFAGSLRQFWQTGIFFWWLMQAFDLWIKVTFPRAAVPAYLRWVYHGIVWGLASSLFIVGFATDAYGPLPIYPFCSVPKDEVAYVTPPLSRLSLCRFSLQTKLVLIT